MATDLTPDEMKQRVANHFEDFVNKRNAGVIHTNMTPDFYDHDGPTMPRRRRCNFMVLCNGGLKATNRRTMGDRDATYRGRLVDQGCTINKTHDRQERR